MIGLAAVAGIGFFADWGASNMGTTGDQDVLAWMWTVAAALVIFGYAIVDYRKLLTSLRFWMFFLTLILLHFFGWLYAWRTLNLKLVFCVVLLGPELAVIYILLAIVCERMLSSGSEEPH